jgi:predicted transcriptional regulator
MALFGGDRGGIGADQTQALAHPIRIRILELFTHDRERALEVGSLAADLGPDFSEATLAQVSYHVAVLRDAQLIPTSC